MPTTLRSTTLADKTLSRPAVKKSLAARLLAPLSQARHGLLSLTLPNGELLHCGSTEHGLHAHVELHRWRALRRAFSGGALGWSESYLDGDWDSPDIAAVVQWALANEADMTGLLESGWLKTLVMRIRHALNSNNKRGSRRNIAYHYDLGNDFYRLWLDETMTYSAALYRSGGASLAGAQRHKYQRLIDQIDICDGDSVLEIGCGWGGFAEHLGQQRKVKLQGITLSAEQLAFARERIANLNLDSDIQFSLTDYRDTAGQYDHIVSVEMLEAVGEAYWPTYFETLYQRLKPGGNAAIQVITIADERFAAYRAQPDFIQTYIFPGGMLPSPAILRNQVEGAGLELQDEFAFGRDYARTLADWDQRFLQRWEEIAPLGFDTRFKRMWHYYLAYCEGGFKADSIDVYQLLLRKPA